MHYRVISVAVFLCLVFAAQLEAGQPTAQATAVAAPSQAAFGETVVLIGSASGFADGPLTTSWAQVSTTPGTAVVLSGADRPVAGFTAPGTAGLLTFVFTAESNGQSAMAMVQVQVSETVEGERNAVGWTRCDEEGNEPAVATAPALVSFLAGETGSVTAMGEDPDDTVVIVDEMDVSGVFYQWSVLEGGILLDNDDLMGADTATVSFNVPIPFDRAFAALSLLVSDAAGCGTLYYVGIVISPEPPAVIQALLGGEQSLPQGDRIVAGEPIVLRNPFGFPPQGAAGLDLSFAWRQIVGSPVPLSASEGPETSFTAPLVEHDEILTFEQTVDDGERSAVTTFSLVATAPVLYFGQVAFGPFRDQVFRTALALINDRDVRAENVTVEVFDFNGDPQPLMLDGEMFDPANPISIGPGLSRILEFAALDEQLSVGWARVTSDVRLSGLVLYQLRDAATLRLDSEVSLFSSPRATRFTTFFGPDDGLAFAAANPGDEPIEVRASIVTDEFDVSMPLIFATVELEPGTQTARFLDETFFGEPLPPDFRNGTLVIESGGGTAILTILKTDSEGLAFSTLPVSTRPFGPITGIIVPNDPPTARLTYRIGASGPFLDAPMDPVAVTAPADITLDAGTSSDPEGMPLTYDYSVEATLTSGGAVLDTVNEALRVLRIAEGSVGTVRVTVTVRDPADEPDTVSIVFEVQ